MKDRLIEELSKKFKSTDTLTIEIASMDYPVQKLYGLETHATKQLIPSMMFEEVLDFLVSHIKADLKKISEQWPFISTYAFYIYQISANTQHPTISCAKAMV